MTDIGQIERNTQNRVVELFRDRLGYHYLGDWQDREGNSNVEEEYLRVFLKKQGYRDKVVEKALLEFSRLAGSQLDDLYDTNKDVYRMLRYGVSIRAGLGEKKETVHSASVLWSKSSTSACKKTSGRYHLAYTGKARTVMGTRVINTFKILKNLNAELISSSI